MIAHGSRIACRFCIERDLRLLQAACTVLSTAPHIANDAAKMRLRLRLRLLDYRQLLKAVERSVELVRTSA